MRMYNSGSETLVPDCLYDQQSMQPMHSEMHNIEEQLRGLSDKDAKRMRRCEDTLLALCKLSRLSVRQSCLVCTQPELF